jgi:hypothetical protein
MHSACGCATLACTTQAPTGACSVCMRQKNAPVGARASQRVTDGTARGRRMAWLLELPMPPVGMTRRSVSSSHQAAYPVVGGGKMREKAEKSRLFCQPGIVCFLLPLHSSGRGYARCMDEHEERTGPVERGEAAGDLARRAELWRRLWDVLLAPFPDEEGEPTPERPGRVSRRGPARRRPTSGG